jgi:hypothetical protein
MERQEGARKGMDKALSNNNLMKSQLQVLVGWKKTRRSKSPLTKQICLSCGKI